MWDIRRIIWQKFGGELVGTLAERVENTRAKNWEQTLAQNNKREILCKNWRKQMSRKVVLGLGTYLTTLLFCAKIVFGVNYSSPKVFDCNVFASNNFLAPASCSGSKKIIRSGHGKR